MRGEARRSDRRPLAKLGFAPHELLPAATHARRLPFGDLVVQQIAHAAVKLRAIRAEEHHVEIIALLPVALRAQLALDDIEKLRAGQRVRNADTDVVGSSALQEIARRQDVAELLADVAEHQEEADADALGSERAASLCDVG